MLYCAGTVPAYCAEHLADRPIQPSAVDLIPGTHPTVPQPVPSVVR